MRRKTNWVAIALLLALAGCNDGISGIYADDAGVTRYVFGNNGEVAVSVLGTKVSAEYRVDGDKVIVSSAQGTVVLRRKDDRLYGPMGLELVLQPDQAD